MYQNLNLNMNYIQQSILFLTVFLQICYFFLRAMPSQDFIPIGEPAKLCQYICMLVEIVAHDFKLALLFCTLRLPDQDIQHRLPFIVILQRLTVHERHDSEGLMVDIIHVVNALVLNERFGEIQCELVEVICSSLISVNVPWELVEQDDQPRGEFRVVGKFMHSLSL